MNCLCYISQDITKKERGADNDSGEEDVNSVSVCMGGWVCVSVCVCGGPGVINIASSNLTCVCCSVCALLWSSRIIPTHSFF